MKIVQQVFKAARDYGPAVIQMDNVDMQLVKKVRGTNTNLKMKTELKKSFTKMTDKMQIVVIGCINIAPAKITVKDLDMFTKKIFFPLPQFADLKLIWKHQLDKQNISYNSDFRLDSLADISYGYTGGSIRLAVNHVLNKRRKAMLDKIPLTINEFIDPLS